MIRIVYTPVGIVIGEKTNAEIGLLSLKEPRLMNMTKNENGSVKISLIPLLGNPKGFEIERGSMTYDCNEEGIRNAYKESVTGLTLVQKPLFNGEGKTIN